MINILLAAAVSMAHPVKAASIEALLRAKDQMLLDAVGTGDHAPWEAAMAENAIFVDEEGNVTSRDAFLKELSPPPPNWSGSLVISKYELHVTGDVAMVIHTDDEQENWHGQTIHAQYVTTETWQHGSHGWKLRLSHAHVMNRDPPSIAISPDKMDEYIGDYRAAPDMAISQNLPVSTNP